MGDEPTLDNGLQVILTVLLKPLGNFSARDLRCRSLLTSALARAVRGSKVIVDVSEAENSKVWLGLGVSIDGKCVSSN